MNVQEVQHVSPDNLPPDIPKMTLEEFLESDLEGYEYIKGELIPMPPTSVEHGKISAKLAMYLGLHVRENQLECIPVSGAGFKVGERVLIPDIAIILTDRLPNDQGKACPIPPDLAVEVVSPTDTSSRVEEKAFAYLEAGTQLVWVLRPTSKTVTVYRSETDITLLTRNDTLSGEEVVKGFSCQVAELFE